MNEDRELLEFAANAAGFRSTKWDERGYFYVCGYEGEWLGPSDFELWNPLTDDADAFRLAVKLEMDVCFGANYVIVRGSVQMPLVNNAGDPYAATRRAIVRAAAEIAKSRSANPHAV